MPKNFTAHSPAPAKGAQTAPPAPPARRIGREEMEAAARQADLKAAAPKTASEGKAKPKEIGGPEGPEPTRYGDWERKGICVDF